MEKHSSDSSSILLPFAFLPCPRQESNLDFELRTLAWSPFHYRDIHASARIRTRNAAFEAPHDHPFQHGGFLPSAFILLPSNLEPVAGFEPATHPYEGRVMPTSPIGPTKKPRGRFRGLGAESLIATRAQRLTRNMRTDHCAPIDGRKACNGCNKPSADRSVSRVGKP